MAQDRRGARQVKLVKRSLKGKPPKGTYGYALNWMREDLLVRLLDDLLTLEATGVDEQWCENIQVLLGKVTNAAAVIPNTGLLAHPIYRRLQDFEAGYRSWNSVEGVGPRASEERRHYLKELRKARNRLAKACRNSAHRLDESHDLDRIDAVHAATITVIKNAPGLFVQLARSARRFAKRIAGDLTG